MMRHILSPAAELHRDHPRDSPGIAHIMKRLFIALGMLVHGLWRLLAGLRTAIANLLLLLVLALIALVVLMPRAGRIPQGCALLLNPGGRIVEEKSAIDPLARLISHAVGSALSEETLLQDILDVIREAGKDNRIKLLVLDPSDIEQASLDQLHAIGRELDRFRERGKKVIAAADAYTQTQYYLAAHADEVYLNPMGQVALQGFALYRLYAREFLEKISVDFHVFRVGTYKSAVEPLLRDDMSAEEREANRLWLNRLWEHYAATIAAKRQLTPEGINALINEMPTRLLASRGDSARLALEAKLVDGLKTGPELDEFLCQQVGKDEDDGFRRVDFTDYLATLTPSYTKAPWQERKIGIIVAHGDIVQGKGGPGQIGSDTLAAQLRRAADHEQVAAVVLRLDTGGGGVLASELIRQELLDLRQTGKPVVVSMGSLAASGGYWIASAADRILAAETTLTGSIGIFGAVPNGHKALAKLGLHSDGIATSPLAGSGNITRPLPPELRQVLQLQVEEGYRRFINLVAEGRSMSSEEVEKLAEGRVWDGKSALELGLVDELGGLTEAVAVAGGLANVPTKNALYIKQSSSSRWGVLRLLGEALTQPQGTTRLFAELARQVLPQGASLIGPQLYGDPGHAYAHSLLPPIR